MTRLQKTVLNALAHDLGTLAEAKSEAARRLACLELGVLAERERARALTLRAAALELLLMAGESGDHSGDHGAGPGWF